MPERRTKVIPDYQPDQRTPHEPTMIELLNFINHQVSQMREELADHMENETKELAKSVAVMMRDAFPSGDPLGHRLHHEAVIRKAEASAKFWTDISTSTAKWGLLGFLGWLVYAAWAALIRGPQ